MEKFDELKTDLHALKVLVSVHETGSFTAAAEALQLNQSTVSYVIDRLRNVFGDPLFVRSGRGVTATERCDGLVLDAGIMLRQFGEMTRPRLFDPETATDQLVISCNSYERYVLLPVLFRHLRSVAPNIRLSVIPSITSGHEQLKSGECDILLSPVPTEDASTYRRHIFNDRYACIVDRKSPHAKGLTMATYCEADHVQIRYDGNWRPFFLRTLADMDIEIDPVLEVPSFGAIRHLLAGTDLVLTAPSRLASYFDGSCIAVEAPFKTDLPVQMFWSARDHDSAKNIWLRDQVVAATAMLEE